MNNKRQLDFTIKAVDKQNRTIEMIGSTENADRVGDRMFMSGVQLQNYLKNPVVLANHNYGSDEKPTVIGKALEVRVQDNQLLFKIQFAETDNAMDWFYLYANGYMNASSIGFTPIEYTANDFGGYDFTQWELLELSLVAVPCNQNAIQRAYKEGHIKSLYENIKKEELELNEKEIQALIDATVNPLQEKIKTLEEGSEAKELIIKTLEDKLKELGEKEVVEPEVKTGASISGANKTKLKSIHADLCNCMKALGEFVGGEPDGDEGKSLEEPTETELQEVAKMAADAVASIIKNIK